MTAHAGSFTGSLSRRASLCTCSTSTAHWTSNAADACAALQLRSRQHSAGQHCFVVDNIVLDSIEDAGTGCIVYGVYSVRNARYELYSVTAGART